MLLYSEEKGMKMWSMLGRQGGARAVVCVSSGNQQSLLDSGDQMHELKRLIGRKPFSFEKKVVTIKFFPSLPLLFFFSLSCFYGVGEQCKR